MLHIGTIRIPMPSLNPQQKQAIKCINQHVLVLAGAGSGKTRVIIEKIAYLLQQNVQPSSIIAVTFTNKAAAEMRHRIANTVEKSLAKDIKIATFHTLGLSILQKNSEDAGYKRGFSIFDTDDCVAVLQQLPKEAMALIDDERQVLWQISALKNQLITPEQALREANEQKANDIAIVYSHYQRQLKAYNAVDFDDLILQPVLLLKSSNDIRQHWQQSLEHLLVDEYQDTNNSQYQFVQLLLGQHAKLTAVGDDDQSIYRWRGAQPENLHKLVEDFTNLQVVKLEQNYRSMGRILKCANAVIDNNPHFFEKKLWSDLGYGDPIRIIPYATPEHEAESIVAEILHKKFQSRGNNQDFAILYRGNHQARLLEGNLRLHNLPYKVSGGTSFFERTEIKDLIAYLKVITNPDDDAAFLRIVNTPRREIGAQTLEKLSAISHEQTLSLFNTITIENVAKRFSTTSQKRLLQFSDWVNELRIQCQVESAYIILKTIVNDIAYKDWLLNTCKDKNIAESRIKNVDDLLEWVRKLCDRDENTLYLEGLVNKLMLMDIIERNDNKENDAIQLMTLHAAKGLEFKHVFIIGFEEGLLPHHSCTEEDSLHEERRLTYVGITRAQYSLTLSYAEHRKRNGEIITCEPSRFLSEFPVDDIEWQNQKNIPLSEKRSRGNANIASLRGILGKA